jgi:hypothetical protein
MLTKSLTNQSPWQHFLVRRALPVGLAASILAALTVKPVRAGIADLLGDTRFGDSYSALVSFFPEIAGVDQWISLIEDIVNDPCEAAPILLAAPSEPGWCTAATDIIGGKGSITSILQDVVGEMGIPDTAKARSTIQDKVDGAGETPDPFQASPEVYGIELGNLGDRAATNLSVQTVLSDEGQQQMRSEIEQSSEVIQSIIDTSNEAQGYDSTQDVVKALARMNAQQSVIAGMHHASSLKARTDTQFTNLNLANISRSLDQQNRDSQSQSAVNGILLLNLTAQSNLF